MAVVLFAGFVFAESVEATAPTALNRNIQITMLRKDQSLVHADVGVYRQQSTPAAKPWSVAINTDEVRKFTLRRLEPGTYTRVVLIDGSPIEAGSLWISTDSDLSILKGLSQIMLSVRPPPAGGSRFSSANLRDLSGAVHDPSGSVISNAHVYVENVGVGQDRPRQLRTDSNANFWLAAAGGGYVVTVMANGYPEGIHPYESCANRYQCGSNTQSDAFVGTMLRMNLWTNARYGNGELRTGN
jgi:hypothetical protein